MSSLGLSKLISLISLCLLLNQYLSQHCLVSAQSNTSPSSTSSPDDADDENLCYKTFFYLDFASHIFKPGFDEPLPTVKEKPNDEKQLDATFEDYKLDDNSARLIDGDILVPIQKEGLIGHSRQKRKVIAEINMKTRQKTRWPNNIVPYEFSRRLSSEMINRVNKAIQHWHKFTCIRFEQYDSNRHRGYRSKLFIQPSNICGAYVGYIVDPRQSVYNSNVFLGTQCAIGNVIHELGHTIGMRHEQSRVDREGHVRINFNRIDAKYRDQYLRMDDPQQGYYGVKYDLFSVMHYARQNGVLDAIDTRRNFLMGQRVGLSFLDIEMANKAYKCSDKCSSTISCQNGGFVLENCRCFCPDGISGRFCENVIPNSGNNRKVMETDRGEPNLDCNFEQGNLCEWRNDKLRSMQTWILNNQRDKGYTELQAFFQGYNRKIRTGPQNGDKSNSGKGLYLYASSLSKTNPNSNFILMSPKIKTSFPKTSCLRFSYNMYQGSYNSQKYPISIGSLSVFTRFANGKEQVLWSKEGNQGEAWQDAEIEFTLYPPATMINIEVKLKDWNYGDIAIDNVEFNLGPCEMNFLRDNTESMLSEWSSWSKCSSKCGRGIVERTRKCMDKDPFSPSCQASLKETRVCQRRPCRVPEFTRWSKWSRCVSIFDECRPSYKYRTRTCRNSDIGDCIGESIEYLLCQSNDECLLDRRLANRTFSSPVLGRASLGRSFFLPAPVVDLAKKNLVDNLVAGSSSSSEIETENESESENSEIDDGPDFKWGNWSKCSAKCSQTGQQVRKMICLKIEEDNDEAATKCNRKVVQVQSCVSNDESCDEKNQLFGEAKWSEWSEWTKCFAEDMCSPFGVQTRERECLAPKCGEDEASSQTRSCRANMEADTREYCKNDSLALNADQCRFQNHSKSCVMSQYSSMSASTTRAGDLGILSHSGRKNFLSFEFDFKQTIVKNDIIELSVSVDEKNVLSNDTDGQLDLCFQVYYQASEKLNKALRMNLVSYGDKFGLHIIEMGKQRENFVDVEENEHVYSVSTNLKVEDASNLNKMKFILQLIANSEVEPQDARLQIRSLFIRKNSCFSSPSTLKNIGRMIGVELTYKRLDHPKFGFHSNVDSETENNDDDTFDFNTEFKMQGVSSETCGGKFDIQRNQKVVLASPNYPNQYSPNLRCNYLITGPPNTKLSFKLIDLDLEKSRMNTCIDGLELRYFHLGQPGPIYCGRLTKEFVFTTYENFIMVIFRSDWGQKASHRGFHLEARVA